MATEVLSFSEYAKLAQRTSNTSDCIAKIECGLMGLNGEAGEAIDIWKKVKYQGKQLDMTMLGHLRKELGDVAWYLAEALTGVSMMLHESVDTALIENIEKLKARYPEGFEVERSEHRVEGDV